MLLVKLKQEYRASTSIVADFRRWRTNLIDSADTLKEIIDKIGIYVRKSLEDQNLPSEDFKERFTQNDDLVREAQKKLYSLDEIFTAIAGCEFIDKVEINMDDSTVSKQIKLLQHFSSVSESYAKSVLRHMRYSEESSLIPKNDLLSAFIELEKGNEETQKEITTLIANLDSVYKQAEQLGEKKVA